MKVEKSVWNGKEGYLLQNESMEVFVNPEDGMNIYQMDWEGRQMIAWEEERYQRKATYGVRVLYPTPVSYTHLDVYKRQFQYSTNRPVFPPHTSFLVISFLRKSLAFQNPQIPPCRISLHLYYAKKQPDRSRGNHRVILLLSSFTLYMLFTSLLPYYLSPENAVPVPPDLNAYCIVPDICVRCASTKRRRSGPTTSFVGVLLA